MAFYILFVFAFASFFDTNNADSQPLIEVEHIPKATMCVLEPRAMSRSLSYEAYAQIEIITCQPHEECRPMIHGPVNIGKFGLG